MDIKAIRSSQASFFESGKTRELAFRLDSLANLEEAIDSRVDAILGALASDLGKPKMEAYLAEVYFVKKEIRLFRKMLKKWAKPKLAGAPFYHFPTLNSIKREPFGCALIMSPWNYPFQISMSPLIAALAAGNCVILKPSDLAPATARLMEIIVREVFAPGHVTVMQGGADLASELLEEPFDVVCFTGSERVGKIVAESTAKNLIPTILELGGKCPVIVDREVDIALTANRIVAAKFFNAGQTCFAPDYVVAHEDVREELIEAMHAELLGFYSEDLRSDLARVVSEEHYLRLQRMFREESDVFKVGEDNQKELRLAPRIISKVEWDSRSMKEEIFGPILPVLSYTSEPKLIEQVKSLSSPLSLYLFAKDSKFIDRFIDSIPSGSVGINEIGKQSANLKMPFGGVGTSGMGRYRGEYGFEAFTYQRAVSRSWFVKNLFKIQPPYAGKLEKNREFLR